MPPNNGVISLNTPTCVHTSDDESLGSGRKRVLGDETGAGDLTLPHAVVEGDVGAQHVEAAVPEVGLAGELVLAGVEADGLEEEENERRKLIS